MNVEVVNPEPVREDVVLSDGEDCGGVTLRHEEVQHFLNLIRHESPSSC